MSALLTPTRRRGVEILDAPDVDPSVVRRSLADVALANRLFGGVQAVLGELRTVFPELPPKATLLDVGTGIGDIPERARAEAAESGVRLTTFGLDASLELARACRARTAAALCADALRLPLPDRCVDVVTCSQLLHHFEGESARRLLRELDRVARVRVIVADLRRHWLAAAGIWLVSFPLRFHPVSRHDGVVSVLRGFTPAELRVVIRDSIQADPVVRRRPGFRITASWRPIARVRA